LSQTGPKLVADLLACARR